jgi:predicted metal-dependent hydrolase
MNESLKDSPKDGPESQFDLWRDADTGRELGAFTVRVSPRARRLSVRVYPDARVEVVAPRRASARLIEAFVAEHREWIETRRVAALRNARPVEPFPPHAISFRASHERWRMHVAGGHGATRIIEFGLPGEEHRVLRAVGSLDRGDLAAALRAWLLKAARVRLEPRLAALAEATGLQYQQLSVRRQRSRWGSCSVRGTINSIARIGSGSIASCSMAGGTCPAGCSARATRHEKRRLRSAAPRGFQGRAGPLGSRRLAVLR